MGGKIEVVAWDKHLGNHIGNISHEDIVSSITNDFQIRVNMVKLHFKWLPTDIIYSILRHIVCPCMVVSCGTWIPLLLTGFM